MPDFLSSISLSSIFCVTVIDKEIVEISWVYLIGNVNK